MGADFLHDDLSCRDQDFLARQSDRLTSADRSERREKADHARDGDDDHVDVRRCHQIEDCVHSARNALCGGFTLIQQRYSRNVVLASELLQCTCRSVRGRGYDPEAIGV